MGIDLNNFAKKEKNLVKKHNPKLYTLGSFQIDAAKDSVPKLSHPRAWEAFLPPVPFPLLSLLMPPKAAPHILIPPLSHIFL